MAKLPLDGIRIIDMAVVWAGPWGSMMMADLGAEVIRVESLQNLAAGLRGTPPRPSRALMATPVGNLYPNREPGERPFNRFNTSNWYLRNKMSMTVDLTRPEGKEVFLRLVKVSDGLVENQAAAVMETLGLTYDVLSQVNPAFIMIRMPMYGITGPDKYRIGYGANMEAVIGHTGLRYYPGTDPSTISNVYHGDYVGGATMAYAFMMAIYYRRRTGKGQFIDISQAEAAVNTLAPAYMDYAMNGRLQQPIGNRDTSMAPQGCYRCRGDDMWVVLSVEDDAQWVALCRIMGKPELGNDPRFADVVSRHQNHDTIDSIISAWTVDRDQYEVMHLLQAAGIAAGPVLHERECLADPHLRERGFFLEITHPEAGTHPYPGFVFQLSGTPPEVRRPAPCLGEHNEYVYKELLGYSDAEFQWFVDNKHAGLEYLPDAR